MLRVIRDFAEIIIFVLVLALLLQVAFPRHIVQGVSMQPTLEPGDLVLRVPALVEQFQTWSAPDGTTYQLGDVIIFEPPDSYFESGNFAEEEDFVKRVIGVPGDVVDIVDGNVLVNGIVYMEIDDFTSRNGRSSLEYPLTVPEDSYFVLGDNRNASSDSRHWGVVPEDNVLGRIWFIYWPFGNASTL